MNPLTICGSYALLPFRKRLVFSIVAIFILGLMAIVWFVYTEQGEASPSLSREEIASDFLRAAFSSTVWMPNVAQEQEASFFPSLFGHSAAKYWLGLVKEDAPWAAPFVGRLGNALPDTEVIHKWPDEITIGFDWPPYGESCEDVPADQYCLNRYTRSDSVAQWQADYVSHPALEKHIKSLIPALQVLTNRPVRFVKNNSLDEKTADYAKIRILLTSGSNQRNFFKSYYNPCGEGCSVSDAGWLRKVEEYFWGAVPFTPQARAQLDGYILPHRNNDIGLAVCRINRYVGDALIKALVTECLIRSLGFPSMLESPKTVLGRWNKAHESHSKLIGIDNNAYLSPEIRYFSSQSFPSELTDEKSLNFTFSKRDKDLIRLLYCDKIKSGMTRERARKVIFSKACNLSGDD